MTEYSLAFSYAAGKPKQTAVFRRQPEDFIVEEQLSQPLSGEGEHFWLCIRKRDENTDWVAKKLAQYFQVKKMDVGYGGKKDRFAVTTQWFSVYLPKHEHAIDWAGFIAQSELNAELIASNSHTKKMKKGEHEANRFVIRLYDLQLDDALKQRLLQIQREGVPNYFGEQRFGRDGGNLTKAASWVKDTRSIRDRNLKGLIMSAARSYLYNLVLSARIDSGHWQQCLEGDPSASASGPLWGRGRPLTTLAAFNLEASTLAPFAQWCDALERVGLQQERRPLCLMPLAFDWQYNSGTLELSMTLQSGEYATSVLREIALLQQPERQWDT